MSTAVDRADEAIAASSTVARRVLKQFKDTEVLNVVKYLFMAAETYTAAFEIGERDMSIGLAH